METRLNGYRPPKEEEWDGLWERIQARRKYWETLKDFAARMEYLQWYTLSRFVAASNLDFFRDCICFLIRWFGFPLEFDSKFERIRRCEDKPKENPYAAWEAKQKAKQESQGGKV